MDLSYVGATCLMAYEVIGWWNGCRRSAEEYGQPGSICRQKVTSPLTCNYPDIFRITSHV